MGKLTMQLHRTNTPGTIQSIGTSYTWSAGIQDMPKSRMIAAFPFASLGHESPLDTEGVSDGIETST
jgi:hypothetical protein